MTGSGKASNVAPHVTTNKGSSMKKQLGGYEHEEGIALLVTDTGRRQFSAPAHPVLTVTATASSLHKLIEAQWANMGTTVAGALGMAADGDQADPVIAKRGFLLKALPTNGGLIYVGGQYVEAQAGGTTMNATGFVLEAGASVFLEITDAANIYLDATDSDESLCWLAL